MAQHQKLPHVHNQILEEAASGVPALEQFKETAETFRLLGDPTRLRIFWILCHGEECVINIAALMSMSSPSVAHHLKLLKMSGLVQSRREGREVYYSAVESDVVATLHPLVERMMELSCPGG